MAKRQARHPAVHAAPAVVARAGWNDRDVRRHRELRGVRRRRCPSSSARPSSRCCSRSRRRAAQRVLAAAWLTTSVAGFALFISYTFGVLHAAPREGLAGAAHRRGGRAVAPLCHRTGRRRRLPRADDDLRARPRRQHQCRDHRRLDGGRRGRHRRRRGPLAARPRQGACRARSQAAAAPRLRRSLQRHARLHARFLDLRHRPRRPRSGCNVPGASRARRPHCAGTPSRCREDADQNLPPLAASAAHLAA